jgi:hypothetical protein
MEEFTMFNHRVFNLVMTMFLMALLTSCNKGTPPSPSEKPTPQKIAEVTDVKLAILKSNPPQLSISAKGNVSSSGWTNPELTPFEYVQPPPDGIYDFTFQAVPPTGPAATVMTPVEATYTLNPIPNTLKGVRIHAAQNSKEAMLETK